MLSRVLSAATIGVDACLIHVETHLQAQIPGFTVVGLPDSAVRESRERVVAAIRNSGFQFPMRKITVNLAPADIRKEGSAFDLPMAVSILSSSGQIAGCGVDSYMMVGELALDGTLRPVHGTLPMALAAKRMGVSGMIVPKENGREGGLVEGIDVFSMGSLAETVLFLKGDAEGMKPERVDFDTLFARERRYPIDLSDVRGQENVKRAMEVAASGGHHMIMIGPPGSGKTMLAKRVPTILPLMSVDEVLETTRIYSVAGLVSSRAGIIASRPYRSPHHTISDAALVGGGTNPRPGEISLAHHGILFLDELPEFARNVLEVLRQPLEDGKVTISRSKLSVDFPAQFMLVCAMNPCLCGYYADPSRECTCLPQQIQRYMAKISGPLMDRIDLHIEVPAVKYRELSTKESGEPSEKIRERVVRAREIQRRRFGANKRIRCNADMQSREIREFCKLDSAGEELLQMAITKLALSARAYDRILKVGRTIADMGGLAEIRSEHVGEAIQYRSLDRMTYRL